MSKTLTQQPYMFANTGRTLWAEGEGLATREAMDLVRELNNVYAYSSLRSSLVMGVQTRESPLGTTNLYGLTGRTPITETTNAYAEMYVAQVPIVIPKGAKRLLWIAGAVAWSDVASSTQISNVNSYLADGLYTGPLAFDVTKLPGGTVTSRSIAVTIAGALGAAYDKAVDATTGISIGTEFARYVGSDRIMNLIVTLTLKSNIGGDEFLAQHWGGIQDYTYWFLYE